MKRLFLAAALCASFIVGACDTAESPNGPSSPASKVVEKAKNVELIGFFYNECCDEDMELLGLGNVVIRENGAHFTVKELSGIGSNGNAYSLHNPSIQNASIKRNADGTSSERIVFRAHMVGENGCSFKMKLSIRVEIGADGVPTSIIEDVDVDCDDTDTEI